MNKIVHTIGSMIAAFVRSVPRICKQRSLWPELPRKSLLRRYVENLYLRFRDGAVCSAYNALGLDIYGVQLNDYIVDGCRDRLMTRFSKTLKLTIRLFWKISICFIYT